MDSYQSRQHFSCSASGSLTKQRIVQTAIEQIARYGPHGATLSQIRESSGQNNRSAIHYHFGGRSGLMLAVVVHLENRLQPMLNDSVNKCATLQNAGKLTIEMFIRSIVCPISRLFNTDLDGQYCVRAISQFLHDTDCEGHLYAVGLLSRISGEMLPFAQAVMPQSSSAEHERLLLLGLVHMVETLTLSRLATGRIKNPEMRFPKIDEADTLMMIGHLYEAAV